MGRRIVINVDRDVEEIVIRTHTVHLAGTPAPLPKRCRAIKRNAKQCGHTSSTARLSDRGLCPSHRDWEEANCASRGA